MAGKFNTGRHVQPHMPSPIITEQTPSGVTARGGAGYTRDTKSELFLLAVTWFPGSGKHHETGIAQDSRFVPLIHQVAVEDPQWGLWFVEYLRRDTSMRTAALIAGAEFAKARLDAGERGYVRDAVDVVCQRADEPGEFLAYWHANFGRKIPMPVKRGLAAAVWRLYTEFNTLKYDSPDKPIRFADVVGLVRPTGTLGLNTPGRYPIAGTWRADLYEWLRRDRFTDHRVEIPESLPMIRARAQLMALPVEQRGAAVRTERLRAAGMTHEALAGWLQRPVTAADWDQMIPLMGVFALLRNLGNFSRARISEASTQLVWAKLGDEDTIRRSGILPLQFLTAYRVVSQFTDQWSWALDQAINHAVGNIPEMGGHTLIMVDTSSSMDDPLVSDPRDDRYKVKRWDAAATFGIALARRCAKVDLVSFSSSQMYRYDQPGPRTQQFLLRPGETLLRAVKRWGDDGYFLGGGTATAAGIRAHLTREHTRVVVLTDEQADRDHIEVHQSVPSQVPMYTLNLAGYRHGHAPSGVRNRHTFGGLTDQMFGVMRLIEAGQRADWAAVFNTSRKAAVDAARESVA
jgi:hypothetical protein